jgi:hypothetical protein
MRKNQYIGMSPFAESLKAWNDNTVASNPNIVPGPIWAFNTLKTDHYDKVAEAAESRYNKLNHVQSVLDGK